MSEAQEKILNKLQEQNKDFTDAYWDIFNNKEAVPADQQARMREELLKYYARTVALLDGQAGLDKEQEIANLDFKRLQIKEEARLRKAELEKQYSLKHVELTARTDTESARLKKEFEIKQRAEEEAINIKSEQIVPVKKELPRRWWQRLFRRPARYYTNYAYELASRKANIEAEKYFASREDEILKLEAEHAGTDELEFAIMQVMNDYTGGKTKGRKAKAINKALSELIRPLCEMFSRRERALTELIEREYDSGDRVITDLSEQNSESACVHDIQSERDKLQTHAVTLLSASCQKRIVDLQLEQLKKPKRQRKRKTRPEEENGQTDDR